MAAPLMVPTLHSPWSEDMIGRPRCCSTVDPCAFMATSSAALLAPHTIIAANNATAFVARARHANAMPIGTAHHRVTARLPWRAINEPVGSITSNVPAPPPSSASPSVPTPSARFAWMAGMRAANMPLEMPCRKKTSEVAIRAEVTA